MISLPKALWAYRQFVVSSVINDLRTRFARSKLGALWMILQPLAMVAIYALVLSEVLGAKLPGIDNKFAYAIYLVSGILCWSLFVDIVTRCLTVFVDNESLLKKMVFPRICLPLIVVGSALVNNVLLLLAAVLVFALLGHMPVSGFLWLPLLIGLTTAFALGLGLLLGILNVFVRDVGQVMQVVLQLWFWMTPIVYTISILPEGFAGLVQRNPLFPLVQAYQNVLVYDRAPDYSSLGWLALLSLILLAVTFVLFRRSSHEMVDVL